MVTQQLSVQAEQNSWACVAAGELWACRGFEGVWISTVWPVPGGLVTVPCYAMLVAVTFPAQLLHACAYNCVCLRSLCGRDAL